MMSNPKWWIAPWAEDQVAALRDYQSLPWVHPYTCAHGHGPLLPRADGWHCGECPYQQDWAWSLNEDRSAGIWVDPFDGLRGEL
jgi:hypothetical protein